MNKNTYNFICILLIVLVVIGGRRLGFSLIERIVAAIIIISTFELIKNKLNKSKK